MNSEHIHVVSTGRDRVFLVEIDPEERPFDGISLAEEAKARAREWSDPHDDQMYYGGPLAGFESGIETDGIAQLNP